MKIDITEEEREFLERVCTRAELFASMRLFDHNSGSRLIMEKDMAAIINLKLKFKKLDTNLIKMDAH